MGAALRQIDDEVLFVNDLDEDQGDEGYGFTMIMRNKHSGEIIKTIRCKQEMITLEERLNLEENLSI